MSKEQFDLYLSLVRKFLKLNSSQIASLSDELADHYHTRCEDLIADGHSIYDAEKLAIEELGDATQLAHQLSTLKHEQQRKWIMRTSLTGLTFFAVACLIFSVMWAPDGRLSTPQSTLAQNESNKNSSTNSSATVTETKSDQGLSRGRTMIDDVEKKLNQQINIDFIDAPLKEVLGEISKLISLDIILDEQSFEEIGISMDAPLTVSLKHSKLPVRDVFKLINRKLGSGVYINVKAENGYASVYVSSEPDMTVKVYDVSDLLKIAAENDPQMQWNKTVDNNNNNSYIQKEMSRHQKFA